MLEQTIICHGSTITVVSAFVMGLEELIRPFQWQMSMIPVLPQSLEETIDAPVPLLVGITEG
jgi:hypothetical protein